jgi:putative tryptophan/tyrosine transport system substrate-binding protein
MQFGELKRREIITLLGSAAVAWPLAARAQQVDRIWRIGYLSATETEAEPQAQSGHLIMEAALARLGYVQGKNLVIERRLLSDRTEQVNEAAIELAAMQPDVIVAVNTPDVAAALSATKTIPIVFVNPADPIGSGFIATLARPGGNATGTTGLTIELIAKRLEVLQEIAVGSARLGFVSMEKDISLPLDHTNQIKFDAAAATAKALGMTIGWRRLNSSRDEDVDALFASIVSSGDQALYVVFDPLTIGAQKRIADLAISNRIPAVYEIRDYVISGGLLSYTYLRAQNFERVAIFIDKIFKGAKPADLPVEQPTRFELVINRRTAEAIGVQIPDKLWATADEVIE